MSLRTRWRPLDRKTVADAPDRPGVYEFGDESGDSLGGGAGVLRTALKEELAYGDAAKVRWKTATSRDHAERLAAEHSL